MKYWPLSVVTEHPEMPPVFADQLRRVYTDAPSPWAFNTALRLAYHSIPNDRDRSFALIESIDAPPRRMFNEMPCFEEWYALERAGVLLGDDGALYLLIDTEH